MNFLMNINQHVFHDILMGLLDVARNKLIGTGGSPKETV